MGSGNPNIDDIPLRLDAEFHKGGVVFHRRAPSSLWEWVVGAGEKWTRVKTLGSGSFGVVWLEKSTVGQLRAVKRIIRPSLDQNGRPSHPSFERELQTLVELKKVRSYFICIEFENLDLIINYSTRICLCNFLAGTST